MLKVDLHTHTADDPVDTIPYTARELIDRAAELRFDALAITLHDRQQGPSELSAYARGRGVELIPGVERTIHRKHVLLLNFPGAVSESVDSFEDLFRLRQRHPQGLVVAPHPFYPAPSCLRGLMDRHADLFDAVELNSFYTHWFDFNAAARRWAHRFGKPVVANSDAHRLSLFGGSCSYVDAEPGADSICSAIKAGRVKVETRPLPLLAAATYFASLTCSGLGRRRAAGLGERDPRRACASSTRF
ncbi:MAG: PHP domain-containing protein [Acidobacteria bacterium]|nr:PHP domain-containing protein [Acidobacteriota bacterium]